MLKETLKFRVSKIAWLLVSALVFFLDQFTKAQITHHFPLHHSKDFLPFIDLTLVHNYGAAFGALAQPHHISYLLIATIIISIMVLVLLLKTEAHKIMLQFSLSLIFGGALGNILDRAQHGYVIDFIDFHIGDWHWYVFNIADVAITLGVFILFTLILFKKT